MNMNDKTVAIIGGSGKMGRWFASLLLKEGMHVIITGRNEARLLEVAQQLGVEATTNVEAVKRADFILVSVPILGFEQVIKEISPHIGPRQLVMDFTSVKTQPVEIMHKYIKGATVLGTHPVFGPGASSLENQNFVLTPTNEREQAIAGKAREFLEARGAKVATMTPQEHDEMMAVILGLAHFIALVSADTLVGLNKRRLAQMEAISGTTFKVLLTLVESVVSEDPELYASLQMSLPGMVDIEKAFLTNTRTWAELVQNKDHRGFAAKMSGLRNRFEKGNPGFEKAYENMYKMVERLER